MTLDDLAAYGANVTEGVARCVGMEAFYLKLVESVKTDPSFEALRTAIADNRLDDAFEASHALKGVLANLSITPILEPVEEICELLRARTEMDYSELMGKINSEYERFLAL